jgi:hypothetical protein
MSFLQKRPIHDFVCFFACLRRIRSSSGICPGRNGGWRGRGGPFERGDGPFSHRLHAGEKSLPAGDAHRLHHRGRDVHGKNHEEFYNASLGYGVLNDFDLYLTAPVVSKNSIEVHGHRNLGKNERAAGFGDMRLIGKYRIWKKGVEAALLAGIKFPTGRTSAKRKSGDKFEAENQPGSGSWDGEFGMVLSRNFMRRLSLATSFQYFLKAEGAQEHEEGDAFRYSVGASYALRQLGKYPNLSLGLELHNEWMRKDKSRTEKKVFDSGGTAIFLTPGAGFSLSRNVSAFCGISLPVYQNLGGVNLSF